MNKLIEFKLWGGAFPYFVKEVIGGVDVDGKRYGLSKDTKTCYLPDTVTVLSEEEFVEKIKNAKVIKPKETENPDNMEVEYMNDEEKIDFALDWIGKNKTKG